MLKTRAISKSACAKSRDEEKPLDEIAQINAAGEVFIYEPGNNTPLADRKVYTIQAGKLLLSDSFIAAHRSEMKEFNIQEIDARIALEGEVLSITIQNENLPEPVVSKFTRITEAEARKYRLLQDDCLRTAPPVPPRISNLEAGDGTLAISGGINNSISFSQRLGHEASCTIGSTGGQTHLYLSVGEKRDGQGYRKNGITVSLPQDTSLNSITEIDRGKHDSSVGAAYIDISSNPATYFMNGKCWVTLNKSKKILDVLVKCTGVKQIDASGASTIVEVKASMACSTETLSYFLNR